MSLTVDRKCSRKLLITFNITFILKTLKILISKWQMFKLSKIRALLYVMIMICKPQ